MKKKSLNMENGDGIHGRTEERKSAQRDSCANVSRQRKKKLRVVQKGLEKN